MITFFAAGSPGTKGSARAYTYRRGDGSFGARVENDAGEKAKAWAAVVSHEAGLAMGRTPLLAGPVSVEITFYLSRPRAHFGARGLKSSAPRRPSGKPDIDKLLRCTLDALTGIAFGDDAQIAHVIASKCYADDGATGAGILVAGLYEERSR